jgi:tetratricopeptide (TPR) repeat protein
MSHSLRRPGSEPGGSFEHAFSGTRFKICANPSGVWQRMERAGDVSDYRVDYVIGSGKHASGYVVRIGDHLFQSPLCYYTRLQRYDMAPGYEENRAPDFIRAVTLECLWCHSGKPLPIKGTLNEYPSPAFSQEAISCDRCHGDPSRHLKMPVPGSIVNPSKRASAERNSICEQCHLKGVARVLNPGKSFDDFRPGQALEDVFTIYTAVVPQGSHRETLKVISHAEQLTLSLCAEKANGRLWCGTCHNSHGEAKHPAVYYRNRCLSCHRGTFAVSKSHPGGSGGDCASCHMFKRNAKDGGHTVFTDHRISRRPEPEQERESAKTGDLVAWREPAPALRQRNLALAYTNTGLDNQSTAEITRGLLMLTEVKNEFPNDPAVLTAMGRALLAGRRASEAARLFERVIEMGPDTAVDETNAGRAWMQAGNMEKATERLERAITLDPLFLPAAEALLQVYRRQGDADKLDALGERVRQALGSSAPQEANSLEH